MSEGQTRKLPPGLAARPFTAQEVVRLTDALLRRVKAAEAEAAALAKRVTELESLLGIAPRDKTLRVGVVDSKPAARV